MASPTALSLASLLREGQLKMVVRGYFVPMDNKEVSHHLRGCSSAQKAKCLSKLMWCRLGKKESSLMLFNECRRKKILSRKTCEFNMLKREL